MAILPNDKIVQEISHDLATYDRDYPRSAAAPSPISEPMGDIFDDDGMDNNEEIERLWVSNVAAEKQNLSRLFEIAVSNLEASLDNNDSVTPVISATQGLCKLHDMDTVFFEEAMHGWVMRTRSSSNCIPFFRALALLITGNSVSIASIAQAALLPSHDQIVSTG